MMKRAARFLYSGGRVNSRAIRTRIAPPRLDAGNEISGVFPSPNETIGVIALTGRKSR